MNPEFSFYFEEAGRGAKQGANSAAEQHFDGTGVIDSLARETTQNSLDAAREDSVRMEVELSVLTTDDIPDIEGLRTHLRQAARDTEGMQGHSRILRAADLAAGATIPVLRISDYGTKGLEGPEGSDHGHTPLSLLTRGAGASREDGVRGGSFGIGSAVLTLVSELNTVLFHSLAEGDSDLVQAGHCRIASHRDGRGEWRVGDGFLTRSAAPDFEYERNPRALGPFAKRTSPGTDIFILGYRFAESDAELLTLRAAFARHFMAAIHRGKLVVTGKTEATAWMLDRTSLAEVVAGDEETKAFLNALAEQTPSVLNHKKFGKATLYLNADPRLTKRHYTMTMRTPLMRIDVIKTPSIRRNFAAVLECSSPEWNAMLRSLEPPTHTRWDGERAPGGQAAVRQLRKFVHDELHARTREELADEIKIEGLARLLPSSSDPEFGPTGSSPDGRSGVGEGSPAEGVFVQGDPAPVHPVLTPPRPSVNLSVTGPAIGEGDDGIWRGKESGGDSSRESRGGTMSGTGREGPGGGLIPAAALRLRSWSSGPCQMTVVVRSDRPVGGHLELVPLGAGGAPEEDYLLPLRSVEVTQAGTTSPVDHEGNLLMDLSIQPDEPARITLTFSTPRRYRLGAR